MCAWGFWSIPRRVLKLLPHFGVHCRKHLQDESAGQPNSNPLSREVDDIYVCLLSIEEAAISHSFIVEFVVNIKKCKKSISTRLVCL